MADHSGRSLTFWQIAFLLGVASLLVAAAAVFGLSAVTASIGLGATILGIVNALLAPQASGSGNQSWLLSRAKNILNVSPYLKGLTIVTWLATLSLGSHGVWRTYHNARLFTIEGVVQTAAGGAADGAIVVLRGLEKERLPIVVVDGKFSFEEVDPQLLSLPRAIVEARWRGLETHVELDLRQRPHPLILKLPPGELPLRLTYRRLDPREIGYIIQGKVSPGLEQRLGGQPYIVPSRTFGYIKKLFKDIDYSFYEINTTDISRGISRNEFYRIVRNIDGWSLAVTSYGTFVQRTVGPQEIAQLFGSIIDNNLYKKVEPNLPHDFGVLTLDPLHCDPDRPPTLELRLREPRLRVAMIENASSAPVTLGSFMIKESDVEVFRKNRDDIKELKQRGSVNKKWFTPSMLRPGEKILIPHSLRFSYPESYNYEESAETLGALIEKVKKSRSKRYPLEYLNTAVHVDRDKLLHMLRSYSSRLPDLEDYVLGTSVMLDELTVDGVLYPLRKPDEGIGEYEEEGYIMLAGDSDYLPATSCPFIYTYQAKQGGWLKEGPVLYGLREKGREASDQIRLRIFDGRILIREEEPETSFIDSMAVKVTYPGGTRKTLYPRNELVAAADGRYLKLEQGEEVEVAFDGFSASPGVTYVLLARGYYLAYSEGSLRGQGVP